MTANSVSHKLGISLLFICCIIEILCLKQWLTPSGNELVSILYLVVGLLIAIIPLFKIQKESSTDNSLPAITSFGLLFILTAYALYHGHQSVQSLPLDYKIADMLPIIEIMNDRWMSGQDIYAIIPEIHGGMYPVYLPAMWLPFFPATVFDFDLRWITIILILSSVILLFIARKSKTGNWNLLLWVVLLYLLYRTTFVSENRIITMTEEGVVIFYYMLLCIGLWRKNAILTGIAISCCLLSRYALVFWVPLYFLYLWITKERKYAFQTAVVSFFSGLALFIVGKSLTKIGYFINLQSNYKDAISDPSLQWKYEPLIESSLGLAKFFKYQNLSILHDLLLILSFVIPAIFLALTLKLKSKLYHPFMGLVLLKISLVTFFNLITMPYIYLFFTSSFISLAILYFYLTPLQPKLTN